MPAHEKRLDEQFTESDLDETEAEDMLQSPSSLDLSAASAVGLNSNLSPMPASAVPLRPAGNAYMASPYQSVVGLSAPQAAPGSMQIERDLQQFDPNGGGKKYVAYTIKLPSDQLAALQTIWLELKRLYGTHSPDKSGMIQQAITDWLRRWDGPERAQLLQDLLEIRQDTRRRQYRK
jgi:hypothetical protein